MLELIKDKRYNRHAKEILTSIWLKVKGRDYSSVHIFTNKPGSRQTDPEMVALVAVLQHAPQLLEALKEMRLHATANEQKLRDNGLWDSEDEACAKVALDQACAAIEAAEGRA